MVGHTGGACEFSDILDSLLRFNLLMNVAEAHRLRLGRRRHDGERGFCQSVLVGLAQGMTKDAHV